MNKNRFSLREKLETMWYFHKSFVVRCLCGDAALVALLYYALGSSVLYLPTIAFPSLGLLNYWLSSRNVRHLHIELPIGFLIASLCSTFIAFVNLSLRHPIPGLSLQEASLNETLSNVFFFGMAIITASTAFGVYTLWSNAEMETQVRRCRLNRDR